jgi:hypothetical protein
MDDEEGCCGCLLVFLAGVLCGALLLALWLNGVYVGSTCIYGRGC